ncbi:unnamed protein product [Chrysoparadoxa australica]
MLERIWLSLLLSLSTTICWGFIHTSAGLMGGLVRLPMAQQDWELDNMTRRELQTLAKEQGVKANGTNQAMISSLRELMASSPPTEASAGSSAVGAASLKKVKPGPKPVEAPVKEDVLSSQWTEASCSQRLGVLQRKLHQVQELEVKERRGEEELNEAQLVKIGRKEDLLMEIADMEAIRRGILQDNKEGNGKPNAPNMVVTGEAEEEALSLAGLPKKLATLMSFCRVSTRQTCEMLIYAGRVTVNGEVVENPNHRVNIHEDEIIANGVTVALPEKFDNKRHDDDNDKVGGRGVRSRKKQWAPQSHASKEGNWKRQTKYNWNVDGGLVAKKTRGKKSGKK